MIQKREVKVFLLNYVCDKCTLGDMVHTGAIYVDPERKYEHRCNNEDCGNVDRYSEKFPQQEFEYVRFGE